MRLIPMALALAAFTACSSGKQECGPEECAPYCEQQGSATSEEATEPTEDREAAEPAPAATPAGLTTFESDLISPILEDIRGGVRPFDDQGIGICKGKRDCDQYLGTDVGELPPGDYILKAELRVPKTGAAHQWKVEVATSCETTRKTGNGTSSSTSNQSREYDVRYAGEDRGYRLMPLRTIQSPSPGGARKCTYTITAPDPDGDKVYKGSWSTPDAD